mgnify:CR=1 FL=1
MDRKKARKDIKVIFGQNLQKARERKGLTREQAASAFGLTRSAFQAYETGLIFPAPEMLLALANFFDVSIDALMGYQRFVNFPLFANYRFRQARIMFEQVGVDVECELDPISDLPVSQITLKSKGRAMLVDGAYRTVEEFTPLVFNDTLTFFPFAEKLLKVIEQSPGTRDIVINELKRLSVE